MYKYTNRGNKYFEIKLFLTFTRDNAVKLLHVVLFFFRSEGNVSVEIAVISTTILIMKSER